MILTETPLRGAFIIDIDPRRDNRGFFSRVYCRDEFARHGLDPTIVQANLSFNIRRGILRGLHFQYPPAAETKLVRCTRGAIVDVMVDLRPESPSFLQHAMVELTAENRRAVYIPRRFAHGYQTLEDSSEVMYQVGEAYSPGFEGGMAYDDPRLDIRWPLPVTEMSDRDRAWKPLSVLEADLRDRMTAGAGEPVR